MFVSNYPWTVSFGNIEFLILQKLLRGDDLTQEEDERALQMSETLDVVYRKKTEEQAATRPHRLPGNRREPREPRMRVTPSPS